VEAYELTAHELAEALAREELSAVDAVESQFARIEAVEAKIEAYLLLTRELALEQARAVDEARARGEQLGPLAGVPYAAKDVLRARFCGGLSRKALEGSFPALLRFSGSVPRRRRGHKRIDQPPCGFCHLLHGPIECGFVRPGRLAGPAELTDKLERRCAHLICGGWWVEVGKRLDIATHPRLLSASRVREHTAQAKNRLPRERARRATLDRTVARDARVSSRTQLSWSKPWIARLRPVGPGISRVGQAI